MPQIPRLRPRWERKIPPSLRSVPRPKERLGRRGRVGIEISVTGRFVGADMPGATTSGNGQDRLPDVIVGRRQQVSEDEASMSVPERRLGAKSPQPHRQRYLVSPTIEGAAVASNGISFDSNI